MKDNGTVNDWGITGTDEESAAKIAEIFFKPYFKIAKDCGTRNPSGCFHSKTYKYLNNTPHVAYAGLHSTYKVILDDGAGLIFSGNINTEPYIGISYDVNGKGEPNQWGKDLFEFIVKGKYVFPSGIPSGKYHWRNFNGDCNVPLYGFSCAAWVIYKGNMDYLHCDGLTWNSKSCKEK